MDVDTRDGRIYEADRVAAMDGPDRAFFRSMVQGTVDDAPRDGPIRLACKKLMDEMDEADAKAT